MHKHSKIRNVPFPRPCGATGNDAQKLHAQAFAHFRDAAFMHEVLCIQKIIRREGFRRDKVRILIKAAEQEAAVVTVGIQHQFDAGALHGPEQERIGIGRYAVAAGDGSGVDLFP